MVLLRCAADDVNYADDGGRTPLWRAVQNNYGCIIRLLLESEDVDVNRLDKCGLKLLIWVILLRTLSVAKLLPGRDHVDPNSTRCMVSLM